MKLEQLNIGRLYFGTALFMLITGVTAGVLSSFSYISPGFLNHVIGFSSLRPLHVSSVMLWILLGATGGVYSALDKLSPGKISKPLALLQWGLWIIAATGIIYSYLAGDFGGREYWEFNPLWSLFIGAAWILFIFNFLRVARRIKKWPVYLWMWMTGTVFFLYIFCENYLWLLPGFRQHVITDMTVQWKVNGSLVGAWNQLIYGSAIYLLSQLLPEKNTANQPSAYLLYFLGLFNLMFNWGHHIYTMPSQHFVRIISYSVSMTEWIVFIHIIYHFKKGYRTFQKNNKNISYWFIMASDTWVFLSVMQAIFMSIPAINLYTHGTHVTVAHAMGTTIGINSMILLALCFHFAGIHSLAENKIIIRLFWLCQVGLGGLWLSLNFAGIMKGMWQMSEQHGSFQQMMQALKPWFSGFAVSGALLATALAGIAVFLLTSFLSNKQIMVQKSVSKTGPFANENEFSQHTKKGQPVILKKNTL